MKKVLKIALDEKQINGKLKINEIDGYEIQLLKDNEKYELAYHIPNILNVHLPFENNKCYLSHILDTWHDEYNHNKFLELLVP